jgi:patatin-like phospholipase/acyl hydrolase
LKKKIFRSWDNFDKLLSPSKIGNSTSAAPTYFPCVKIKDSLYIDSGVFANNPCLIALQEAHKLWGKDADIRILSIVSGHQRVNKINGDFAENWGTPQLLYNGFG